MTRTLLSKSSKKKQVRSSQEVFHEDCSDNSPSILSQTTMKKLSNSRSHDTSKENRAPREILPKPLKSPPLITDKETYSVMTNSVNKSVRYLKKVNKNKCSETENKRCVLYDKTNSLNIRENKPHEQSCCLLNTTESKNNTVLKLDSVLKQNCNNSCINLSKCVNTSVRENHVPIYKSKGTCEDMSQSNILTLGCKEAIYEFQVNEIEEPLQKKKRKKRVNMKKPKLGPKSLTINNIKYGSTESLVTLPEKSVRQKIKSTKNPQTNLKPHFSVTNLSDSYDICSSIKNLAPHPSSQSLRENKKPNLKFELSVLQETESEHCQSQIHESKSDYQMDVNLSLSGSSEPPNSFPVITSKTDNPLTSYDAHYSPRCYASKTNHTPYNSIHLHHTSHEKSVQNTCPEISSSSVNSSRKFLSSTPCKQILQVDRNSSKFYESYKLRQDIQSSTGFIRDSSDANNSNEDNCFGFDEPEEIEEPLVSPIKNCINLNSKPKMVKVPQELESINVQMPKPALQEVINILKSTIPEKKQETNESSSVFDIPLGVTNPSSPPYIDQEQLVNFKKPPRNSYGRQRRIRHYSQNDESELESSDLEEETVKVPNTARNYYKKSKCIKTVKPAKTVKFNQKVAKEEEEIERLAAQMNAQFEKIEKVNLVVE